MIEYSEKIKLSFLAIGSFLLGIVIFLLFCWIFRNNRSILYFLFFLVLFTLFIFINLRQFRIVIDEKYLIFGFGLLRIKIKHSAVIFLGTESFSYERYQGFCIRLDRKNDFLGFIPSCGDGIKIQSAINGRKYFFITRKPEELKNILQKKRNR